MLNVLDLFVRVFMLMELGSVILRLFRVILFIMGFEIGDVFLEGVWIKGLSRLMVSLRSFW